MWAPVPPEMEYTQTRPPCPRRSRRRASGPGGWVRAKVAETSSSWSRPSTRVMPNWRKAAETTASDPVKWPVWALAIEVPSAVRPTLTATTGTRCWAAAVGGELQRPPALESLHVAGDGPGVGQAGEVGDEVGHLEVGLVARRGPVREADPDLLALVDRSSLVPTLRDEGDRLAREVLVELLEGVEVGVGAEHPQVTAGDHLLELVLQLLTFSADLGKARREDHREPGARLDGVPDDGNRIADQDGHQVDADTQGAQVGRAICARRSRPGWG